MVYEDFEVQIGPRSGTGFLVRVLRSPAGEGEGILHLPEWDDGSRPLAGATRNLISTVRRPALSGSPIELGGSLYRALFAQQVGLLFHQSLSRIDGDDSARGLRIRLRFNPRDPDLEALQRAPWELLYREDTEDFLALSRFTPVVRAFDLARSIAAPRLAPPLRILIASAQDPLGQPLNLASELEQLTASLRRNTSIEIEVLNSPDSRTLRATLAHNSFHVLHFMGHAGFDPRSGEGALLFRGPQGNRESISGRHLATKIKDFSSLRLVVLNACETARASATAEHGPFAGVAAALVLGGIPCVVAMQSPIEDSHAVAFSSAFYDRLAHGTPVDEAMTEGRQAIHSLRPTSGSWAVPVLFLRTPSGDLFAGTEKAAPEPGSRRLRSPWSLGTTAVLLLLVAFCIALWVRLLEGRNPPGAMKPANQTLRTETLKKPPAPPPVMPAEKPAAHRTGAKSSPNAAEVQTVRAGGLRFEVSATSPSLSLSFAQALDHAARGVPPVGSSAESVVRLAVGAPQLSSYSDSGVALESCSLSVSPTVKGPGPFRGLGPILATGSAIDGEAACAVAAEKLAVSVVQKLSQLTKEESR
jgi:CHAT domain-containing protein